MKYNKGVILSKKKNSDIPSNSNIVVIDYNDMEYLIQTHRNNIEHQPCAWSNIVEIENNYENIKLDRKRKLKKLNNEL
jgi:hypothetical protein